MSCKICIRMCMWGIYTYIFLISGNALAVGTCVPGSSADMQAGIQKKCTTVTPPTVCAPPTASQKKAFCQCTQKCAPKAKKPTDSGFVQCELQCAPTTLPPCTAESIARAQAQGASRLDETYADICNLPGD